MPRKDGGRKAAPERTAKPAPGSRTESCRHPEAPPAKYRYDSSLSPAR
jgi:hypothetical protein